MSERGSVGGGLLVLHSEKMGRQNKAVLQGGCYGSRGVILLCPAPKRGQTELVYENGMLTKQRFIKVLYRCSKREDSGHRRSRMHLSASGFSRERRCGDTKEWESDIEKGYEVEGNCKQGID